MARTGELQPEGAMVVGYAEGLVRVQSWSKPKTYPRTTVVAMDRKVIW